MTEKEFLKILNSDENFDGSKTIKYVKDLLYSDGESNAKKNTIKQIYNKMSSRKDAADIVKDNFLYILFKTQPGLKSNLLKYVFNNDSLKILSKQYFKEILRTLNAEEKNRRAVGEFILRIKDEFDDGEEFINENLEIIIKNVNIYVFFDNIYRLKGMSEETDELINNTIEENKYALCKEILQDSIKCDYQDEVRVDDIDYEDYSKTIAILIDELLESEAKKWIDVHEIGHGSSSHTYSIGNKVIKIGAPRTTYIMPNDPTVLQPLIRTNLRTKNSDEVFACIEIADEVDTNVRYNSVYKEKLYNTIFKPQRDRGIRWTDIHMGNIGILKRPNSPTLGGKPFYVDPKSVGFDKENDNVRQAGELVSLDSDFFYKNETPRDAMYYGSTEIYDMLEKRYRHERALRESKDLTREKLRDLVLEYRTEVNRPKIALILADFAIMEDKELKKFFKKYKTVGEVENYIIDRVQNMSRNKKKNSKSIEEQDEDMEIGD